MWSPSSTTRCSRCRRWGVSDGSHEGAGRFPVAEASPGSPAAALTVRPGLRVRPQRPARAFVGALVVVAAVVAALALYSRIGDRREVLMVTRTVLAGEQLSDADLRVVSVGSDADFAGGVGSRPRGGGWPVRQGASGIGVVVGR